MVFDPDEFVLPDEPIGECIDVETQALRQARRQRRRNTEWFAKGPFPLSWIVACRRADPNGLDLAVGVLMKSGRSITEPDHKWVPITGNLGDQLGLSRGQRQRAVKALAIAGLAEIQLVSKHAPKLRLMQWELKERSAA